MSRSEVFLAAQTNIEKGPIIGRESPAAGLKAEIFAPRLFDEEGRMIR
jgi:hypothetical protein